MEDKEDWPCRISSVNLDLYGSSKNRHCCTRATSSSPDSKAERRITLLRDVEVQSSRFARKDNFRDSILARIVGHLRPMRGDSLL